MPTIKTKITFLRELLALKEVIDLGQIQAAADRNGIKHSNMSKIISDLEARFKTRLLIRSSAGSVPTNTTRQLYADIENIVNTLDNIFQNITGPDELTGYISIWTEEGFGYCRYEQSLRYNRRCGTARENSGSAYESATVPWKNTLCGNRCLW